MINKYLTTYILVLIIRKLFQHVCVNAPKVTIRTFECTKLRTVKT